MHAGVVGGDFISWTIGSGGRSRRPVRRRCRVGGWARPYRWAEAASSSCRTRGERLEHLWRGMAIASLLEANVVVDADAGEHRYLLAPQSGCTAAPQARDAHLLGLDKLAPRPKRSRRSRSSPARQLNDRRRTPPKLGVSVPGSSEPWWTVPTGPTLSGMTEKTVIQTGFGAGSSIWDVVEGLDLSGKRAIGPAKRRASASRPPAHSPPPAPR
jgi:hypothetical protein